MAKQEQEQQQQQQLTVNDIANILHTGEIIMNGLITPLHCRATYYNKTTEMPSKRTDLIWPCNLNPTVTSTPSEI